MDTGNRKDEHLKLCLEEEVEYSSDKGSGFDRLRFDHDALPEVSKNEIKLEIEIFGYKLSCPLIIGAMTGGTRDTALINERLAEAAQLTQVGFALGSQRKMLEDPSCAASFCLKRKFKNIPLFIGNMGAVQLNYGLESQHIQSLIEETQVNAFAFHLNPLQEAIQPEGDTNFSNLLVKLSDVIPTLKVPVLIKEVGAGISETTAKKLQKLAIAGIETAGRGGTSWSKIESLRTKNEIQKSVGELFTHWGIPTTESIKICRQYFPSRVVIASGGIRNGIEVAKAIALGADAAALAHPFLKAAHESLERVLELIERIKEELRTTMFVTGCRNIGDLRKKGLRKYE
ncbi:MAG TPA: type 2 isopentenyl-diphosphate Delta-isomerase [Bdellovibrionota bacterium]|nr:type 2 isopentenyl-diphosphate Delta-isomerase [Bdellovibrionota bacterium]